MCSEYVMWLLSKAAITGENKMWPSFLAELYCTRLLLELQCYCKFPCAKQSIEQVEVKTQIISFAHLLFAWVIPIITDSRQSDIQEVSNIGCVSGKK